MHRFPQGEKNKLVRQHWIANLQRKDFNPGSSARSVPFESAVHSRLKRRSFALYAQFISLMGVPLKTTRTQHCTLEHRLLTTREEGSWCGTMSNLWSLRPVQQLNLCHTIYQTSKMKRVLQLMISCLSTLQQRMYHIGCTSLMARSFWFHALLCRLCGCFFIRDLYGDRNQRAPRVVWRSWYTLYSCFCLAFLIWTSIEDITVKGIWKTGSGEAINQGPHKFSTGLLMLRRLFGVSRTLLNFFCMCLCASRLLQFYKRASAFERTIGLSSDDRSTCKRFFWSDMRQAGICVVYCAWFVFASSFDAVRQSYLETERSLLMIVLLWSKTVLKIFFYFVYKSLHFVALSSSAQVLTTYIKTQLGYLNLRASPQQIASTANNRTYRAAVTVRLNLSTIRQLKEDVNDIWCWPLVFSTCNLLVVSGTCLYEVFHELIDLKLRLISVVYAVYLTGEFIVLASSSQSLIDTTKELRLFCEAARCDGEVSRSFEAWVRLLPISASPGLFAHARSLTGYADGYDKTVTPVVLSTLLFLPDLLNICGL
ncbi:hypothetical protein V5799_021919 [Amblyomma americanum]|uniref:Gustatory receptor n=1 Tax=Amblyomma americanum TaxID=6943 RepID=A0AAQ4FMH7_AMBAM